MPTIEPCAWCGHAPEPVQRGQSLKYRCRNNRCYQYKAGARTLERWNNVQAERQSVMRATGAKSLWDSNDMACSVCGMTSYNGSSLCDKCAVEKEAQDAQP